MKLMAVVLISVAVSHAEPKVFVRESSYARIDSCLMNLVMRTQKLDSASRADVLQNVQLIRSQLQLTRESPQASRARRVAVMDSVRFEMLVESVKNARPFRERLTLIRRAAPVSRFTMDQTNRLVQIETFADEKRKVASILLPRTIDLENVEELFETLWTTADQRFLLDLVDSLSARRD